jgi:hypothetical protein
MRYCLLLFAQLLAAAIVPAADAPPAVVSMEGLGQNGRSFLTSKRRLELHCLDVPGLMAMGAAEQAALLDRAAAAGFNAVSFEAPLIGPGGFSPVLGKPDPASAELWQRTFEALALRRLYAFPVLWTPATMEALVGKSGDPERFFAGKNALGWQAWALRQALTVKVHGRDLGSAPSIGAWILYRGPWPDAPPLPGRNVTRTPSVELRLNAWARWQGMVARKAGLRQMLGLGLWAKDPLPATRAPREVNDDVGASVPLAPLSAPDLKVDVSDERMQAMDALPPVPGADAEFVGELDDSDSLKPPPSNPWDLEGLDWSVVEAFFETAPIASQVDFLEFTLDTEDWYRVGERLADAAAKAEVPVLWRQDWRHASRYERTKRLTPPGTLAGLSGPWPPEEWPAPGESLWPPAPDFSPESAPFLFRSLKLVREGKRIVLVLELNRPATVTVHYGPQWPLSRARNSPAETKLKSHAKARLRAEHRLALEGLEAGKPFLLRVNALSAGGAQAVLRTRWVRAPE